MTSIFKQKRNIFGFTLGIFALSAILPSIGFANSQISQNKIILAQATQYRTYYNSRFQYAIDYPPALLRPQGEATNGDGQAFLSPDGMVKMLAYGSHLDLNATLYGRYMDTLQNQGIRVTYKSRGKSWYVVSGFKDNGRTIYYEKTLFQGGVFKIFQISYPVSRRNPFDQVTGRLSQSFRSL